MEINIPELSLVVLIGASGSGKSRFAKKHFRRTEILTSDECRALVSDDENNQAATVDAFDVLHYIAEKRLKRGLLTVVDATNVQKESRKGLLALAKAYHFLPVAIVLDTPENVCEERNQSRPDRNFGSHVIRQQSIQLKKSLSNLKKEGFRQICILKSVEEIDSVTEIRREKLQSDKKDEKGPFDIIGDVHGCFDELQELLTTLGYQITRVDDDQIHFGFKVVAPDGRRTVVPNDPADRTAASPLTTSSRKVVFLGDLVDRGPNSPDVLRLAMSMVNAGIAYCVPGNHDSKLQQFLNGRQAQLKHGLELTAKQFEAESQDFKRAVEQFLYHQTSHYVFDGGKLVTAHAGLLAEMQGRGSGAVRAFCTYGGTTGETDEFGLPVRPNWANEYRGDAKVVYGHTPVLQAEWLNRTIDIDTGCVFGGQLTALRYPEEELVAVKAKKVHYEPVCPLNSGERDKALSSQHQYDDLLNIEDVIGKRIVQTRLRNNIVIREENSIAALEAMSRFAVNPKWLIYLPPTMSPCLTSELPDFLEYPTEALDYYKKRGIEKVVCEEKHMGSRAVLIVCKDETTALKRFGIENEGLGTCYTRSGRNFFNEPAIGEAFVQRVNQCLTNTCFWEKFDTGWVCLDTEIMPWSAKAQALLKDQYASVGVAASASLSEAVKALQTASDRGMRDALPFLEKFSTKSGAINKYVNAYQNYCWTVHSLDDYKLAPFHILATEGHVHVDKSHEWHLTEIDAVCAGDARLFHKTAHRIVDLNDPASYDGAVRWWVDLTNKGSEGMVVKPYQFVAYESERLLQPAIKCRGHEYLRIIYGPEYDMPENMERLKNRGLSAKQSLAIREFALGVEGLERFVGKEPLRRIHESIFGILALESEDIDPRL